MRVMFIKILALALIFAPSLALAAPLTWGEYYDYVAILNHELSYNNRVVIKGNIYEAIMAMAEKREAQAFEYYREAKGAMKLQKGFDYTNKRTDLFAKVRSQFR